MDSWKTQPHRLVVRKMAPKFRKIVLRATKVRGGSLEHWLHRSGVVSCAQLCELMTVSNAK